MQNACMVALQIRDVPDEVRDILAARARSMGQSLQSLLLSLVKDEARRSRNVALLQSMEARADGVGDDDPGAGLAALDEARATADKDHDATGTAPAGGPT